MRNVLRNTMWNNSRFSNCMRVFLFKLTNNTLPVNTIVSHFVRGISRNCTFCDITFNPEPEDERIFHLLYDCKTATVTRNNYFKWLTVNENFSLSRHEFFCCGSAIGGEVIKIAIQFFKFYLWDCKQRKCLPVLNSVKKIHF
jgi:hypothetical protein